MHFILEQLEILAVMIGITGFFTCFFSGLLWLVGYRSIPIRMILLGLTVLLAWAFFFGRQSQPVVSNYILMASVFLIPTLCILAIKLVHNGASRWPAITVSSLAISLFIFTFIMVAKENQAREHRLNLVEAAKLDYIIHHSYTLHVDQGGFYITGDIPPLTVANIEGQLALIPSGHYLLTASGPVVATLDLKHR